jgi:hypothetical protein
MESKEKALVGRSQEKKPTPPVEDRVKTRNYEDVGGITAASCRQLPLIAARKRGLKTFLPPSTSALSTNCLCRGSKLDSPADRTSMQDDWLELESRTSGKAAGIGENARLLGHRLEFPSLGP